MLLSFEVENYKSFKDRTVFSMEPAPKQKGLDYSILKEKIANKNYKGLSAAVIYGPNASGKTNIIGALQTLKSIVLRGNIRDCEQNTQNIAESALELIPNNLCKQKMPVSFSINFTISDLVIGYSLSLDLGIFLDRTYQRSVLMEKLIVNDKVIFSRNKNSLKLENVKSVEDFLIQDFFKNKNIAEEIAGNSLNATDLFLCNGFRNIISSELANIIINFFANKLKTFYHTDSLFYFPAFENTVHKYEYLNNAAKEFGINSNELVYIKDKKTAEPVLCSILKNNKALPASIFESYGTIRFVNIFPALENALKLGEILVIDEFDASIHPMAIMSIIDIFHNDEINKKHAQLIFNTHNPLYLNNNLFRRDEIKFVERDDETKCSHHYSLSDFGTSGTKARKGKDYMKNYFVNEYGAIRDIDFTSVFENIMKGV